MLLTLRLLRILIPCNLSSWFSGFFTVTYALVHVLLCAFSSACSCHIHQTELQQG